MIGKNILKIRQAKNLSIVDVCDIAQISRATLIAIEAGRVDSKASTLLAIAKALDVKVAIFFELEVNCTLLITTGSDEKEAV